MGHGFAPNVCISGRLPQLLADARRPGIGDQHAVRAGELSRAGRSRR
jgi:hypothetical protein